jgi:hypothetical protein
VGEGWDGSDPSLRRLRIMAAVVILGLLSYVVVAARNDPLTLGTLVGALLIDLGFEVGVRWLGSNGRPE